MFEEQVARTPDHTAVVHAEHSLTYRELNFRANRLARRLIALGAGPEHLVALLLPRSARTVTTLLAVVKAGAAWIPVDTEYPAARVNDVLDTARPLLLLTAGDLDALVPGARVPDGTRVVDLDAPGAVAEEAAAPAHDVTDGERRGPLEPDHPAYVIFTSGSTGRPKGVVMTHRGLGSLAADHIGRFGIRAGDAVLQFASFSFDCSVGDLVMAVGSGAALVVRPRDCLSGRQLAELVARTSATHMTIPPQVLAALPPLELPTLRSLATAGDVLTTELVDRWAPGRLMVNAYGPTETTVDSLAAEVTAGGAGVPPIGRPVLGTRAHVLDEDMREVPAGVEGELFLAGPGLARGYLGRPGLTADRFPPCPFGAPGERMYRTGDLVRRLPDGDLVFVGRVDEQVKVRGFRVEPAEVEAVLRRHPEVVEAVVTAREDVPGHKRLVAHVVPTPGAAPDAAALRRHVGTALPEHFVPSAVVLLPALPLTSNGKIDRKALPAPPERSAPTGREFGDPRESLVAGLFREVLGVGRVGVDDGFFDLGGDSVSAIRLAAAAHERGWVLEPAQVFEHQRPSALAPVLLRTAPESAGSSEEAGALPPGPLPARSPGGARRRVLLTPPDPLPVAHLAAATADLTAHHQVLRLVRTADGGGRITRPADLATAPPPVLVLPPETSDAELLAALGRPLDPPPLAVACAADGSAVRRLLVSVDADLVDTTALHVLVADLGAAWRARSAGLPVALAPVEVPWADWLRHTADAGHGVPAAVPPAPVEEVTGWFVQTLPAELAGPLLDAVPAAFRTGPADAPLTALALAVADHRDHRDRPGAHRADPVDLLVVDDGRRPPPGGARLDRTVGPLARALRLRLVADPETRAGVEAGGPAAGDLLKSVKERLLAGGDPAPDTTSTQGPIGNRVGYAHQGRPGQDPWVAAATRTRPGPHPAGCAIALTTTASGTPERPGLDAVWTWIGDPTEESVRELAEGWLRMLRGLVAHAARPGSGGPTPSDITLLALSQDDIDDLANEWTHDF
ncbi:amino acid adenylation domain-containing protein (plasmid) [Streptomyces sp. BI20]|uniref:amino acid adenylation domain-containing protein n=1 Tax=Streptomyces sp. BI20 TaxID=3403460 RepID=UPI003C70A4DC